MSPNWLHAPKCAGTVLYNLKCQGVKRAYIGCLDLKLVLRCSVGLLGACDGDSTGQQLMHHDRILALNQQQGARYGAPLWVDAVQGDIGML